MTENLTLLLLGLGSGSMIALSAFGLVLMYRSSGVVNFSTGGLGMASGYIVWDLTVQAGMPALLAGVLAVLASAVLGFLSYIAVMVLPRAASTLTRVVATLAILIILQSIVQLRFGATSLTVESFLPPGQINLGGGVAVPASRVVLFGVAILLTAALTWFYSRSTFGLATSALAERPRTLAGLGWPIGRVGAINWSVGGGLAGLAGALLVPIISASLSNGNILTVTVLAAALIGGLRSFPLTLAGGLVIGMSQSLFTIHDFGVTGLADAVPLVLIIGVIVLRGRKLPLRSFVGERLPSVGSGRLNPIAITITTVVVVVLVAFVFSDNVITALTVSLLMAIPMLSLTIVLGYAGQMSLAQLALSGVGGLVAARLVANAGFPFAIALIIAVLCAIPIGLLVGLPSSRTRGVSLAVTTLSLAVAIQALIFGNDLISGGKAGIPVSTDGTFKLFGLDFGSFIFPDRFAYLVLGFVIVLGLVVVNVRRGASGRRMVAVRNNERAASALGIDVVTTKMWAFGMASGIAAVGGVLTAFSLPVALFTNFSVTSNVMLVGYAIIGGAGSVVGVLFGSTMVPAGIGTPLLQTIIPASPVVMALIGGVVLLVTVITSPDGIATAFLRSLQPVRRLFPPRRATREEKSIAAQLSRTDHQFPHVSRAELAVQNLAVAFGPVRAVGGISFHVRPGEILGVIGANGAGKTTLIDAITGFVTSSGSAKLAGVELTGLSAGRRSRLGVSRSWQSLELIEDLTVLDNLRTATDSTAWWSYLSDTVRPGRREESRGLIRAVKALDLDALLYRYPKDLSTGQRKLVAIARAVASEPSILLLDEPCSGLDNHERREVAAVIRSVAEEWGMGVMLVEHDTEMVSSVSDRVIALDRGVLIAEGTPVEVMTHAAVLRAYLGDSEHTESTEPAAVEPEAAPTPSAVSR